MLYLYITVSKSAVSGVLVREEEGGQKPVYYVSYTRNGSQTRYQRLEKLVLALLIISRKLKHYFQTFTITVLTEHPLRSIVENPKVMGRISKWTSELRSYGLKYETRIVIKGRVLADFIANFTPGITEHTDQLERWVQNVDEALQQGDRNRNRSRYPGGIHHRAVLHPRLPRIQQRSRI